MKLKPSEVPGVRARMLKKQRGICPLCKIPIQPHDAALDHDHATGYVRAVLHRQCNTVEGKVNHWATRAGPRGIKTDRSNILRSLLRYWAKDYSGNPEHPNHGRPKKRRIRRR